MENEQPQPSVDAAVKALQRAKLERNQAFLQEYTELCQRHGLRLHFAIQCDVSTSGVPRYYANPEVRELEQG